MDDRIAMAPGGPGQPGPGAAPHAGAAPVAGGGPGQPVGVAWSGSPWDLAGLGLVNFLLSIVTLGIYGFWGRAEVRRRIWSSVRLDGEPLVYTGTGKELFLGFLFGLFAVLLPIYAVLIGALLLFGPNSIGAVVVQYLVTGLFFLLMGMAIYRARRYRLTRTEWRGIRGGMAGQPSAYSWHWIWTGLLVPLTLGWIVPWRANRLYGHLTRETTFGDRNFGYEGSSKGLYGPFALLWVGGILLYVGTIGAVFWIIGKDAAAAGQRNLPFQPSITQILAIVALIMVAFTLLSLFGAWYRSRTLNLFAAYTGFDRAQMSLATTAPGLIGLIITNFLITACTLGILAPVAQARTAKYIVDRLAIDGTIDVEGILQSQAALGRGGEGMAQVLDVDAF